MTFIDLKDRDTCVQTIVASSGIALVLAFAIWKIFQKKDGKSTGKRDGNKAKKPVALSLETMIENVSLRYENEFKPRIETLKQTFSKDDEKKVYERNYCNEMLLKLLIELDGIDLVNLEPTRKQALKAKRKLIIKTIQTELRSLDELK